ncbi:hypothetical protein [Oceaniglobus roseus]|uniref:hypothetical protein n=1 Tax=Oceaniglobus roseus TaxID=1737570 RepID=UPI000C7F26A1|nr:hypothetical protein [Kandeliimicrobium roseum]
MPKRKTEADARTLSLYEVYSGYVLTQGQGALQTVVLKEKLMRFTGTLAAVAMLALWFAPGAHRDGELLTMKLLLSALLLGPGAWLLLRARARAQHEVRVDLIHREVRQVMRGSDGSERFLLAVAFDEIESLFIRRNREEPTGSALYMRLHDEEAPVLLGISTEAALEEVHRRMSADLTKARMTPPRMPPRRSRRGGADGLQPA